MSGICAVLRKDHPGFVAKTLGAVTAGLSIAAEGSTRECDQLAGIGVSARFPEQRIYRDGRFIAACDADLLNENELANAAGHKMDDFPAAGTAALFVALYERFGASFVGKLRGAFSFVLWDGRERRLAAGIDGFGIKRLAYYEDEKLLLISSRVDSIAKSGEVDLRINPRAVANILNFSVNLAPQTIFTKIHRFSPGAIVDASDRGLHIDKFWDLQYGVGGDPSETRLSRELESVLQESVGAHCKTGRFSDFGAFLSGGTDSSTVVGLMTRTTGKPVKAFSIGFQEQVFNELSYAELAAKKFGSEHYTELVGADACFEALPRIICSFDEPFANSSAIPTYFCAHLAAQNGVQALLGGDGGDELFGGNERYAIDKIFEVYHSVPAVLRKGLIEPMLAVMPGVGPFRRAQGYVRRANIRGIDRMLSFQSLRTYRLEDIFEADCLQEMGPYSVVDIPAAYYSQAPARDHLDRLLYVDMKITLGDSDLPKVTCMSELAGIRTRFPFLDRSVAEFSGRVPARLKVKGFDKRYLFKRAFRELLPVEIIRKKKHGFGIPVANWMKSDKRMRELSHDTLLSSRAFERGYFRRSFVEELFRLHQQDDSTFYGDTLWAFLMVELWHRQAVDQISRVVA